MKIFVPLCCLFTACATNARATSDEVLDQVAETLTWTAWHDTARLHISGSLELEGYVLPYPSPGLLYTDDRTFLNPRLTLFLDAQLGPRFYFFAQSRVDHGFDPGETFLQIRLDEYALRFTPRDDGAINFQIGKFATVVGNWVQRHYSWDNPFITAPLPYENLTGIFDGAAANSAETLLKWSGVKIGDHNNDDVFKPYRLPVIWGPSYASGVAVTGKLGKFEYAIEGKNAALASRPSSWDANHTQWQQPTFSGHLGYHPNESWNFGVSASTGSYLLPTARPTLAHDYSLADYREIVLGQDISFAWHHLQIWAEAFETRFSIPLVGEADVVGYYLEAKYKFTPQFFGAVRWNQQFFGSIPDGAGGTVRWGSDISRLDLAPSYRFTSHSELKLQYSLQDGGNEPRRYTSLFAAQFILRF